MCRSLLFFLKLLNVAEARVSFFPVFSCGEIAPGQEVKWVLIFTECNVNCGEVNIWFLNANPVSLLLIHANWSWNNWKTVSTYSLFIGITYLYWSCDDVLSMMYWYCISWLNCQNYACLNVSGERSNWQQQNSVRVVISVVLTSLLLWLS